MDRKFKILCAAISLAIITVIAINLNIGFSDLNKKIINATMGKLTGHR
jgi:hypothetical protein